MSEQLIDKTVVAAIVAAFVTLVGTVLTHKIRHRKADGDYWAQLQEAQAKFRAEIHAELDATKVERDELRDKINALERRVSELVAQNERLVLEKLTWMQKATSLQLLLQKAMQSLHLDSNRPLSEWMSEEMSKIDQEVADDNDGNHSG